LGAISPFGIVNIQLRRPTIPSKKRRLGSNDLVVNGAGSTVTGHYINFVKSTLDVLDNHEEFKGHYIVMDNAPIHTSKDIERYITSRGYGCIYLPPYSPELNPIEQFWSVVKSKLKREKRRFPVESKKHAIASSLATFEDFAIIPPQNLMIA
jgi:hypothetical protein